MNTFNSFDDIEEKREAKTEMLVRLVAALAELQHDLEQKRSLLLDSVDATAALEKFNSLGSSVKNLPQQINVRLVESNTLEAKEACLQDYNRATLANVEAIYDSTIQVLQAMYKNLPKEDECREKIKKVLLDFDAPVPGEKRNRAVRQKNGPTQS